MEKKAIEQLIDTGIKIQEERQKDVKALASKGVADFSADMPASMHEWMSNIKIYAKRHLKDHPLCEDIELVLFHNKNKKKDYDKMMGLLKALLKDTESLENTDSEVGSHRDLQDIGEIGMTQSSLSQKAQRLLKEIIDSENPTDMVGKRFERCSHEEDTELRKLLQELGDTGYIKIPLWADDVPQYIQVNQSIIGHKNQEVPIYMNINNIDVNHKKYDVFLSHANKDKIDYVNSLYETIKKLGINIFYDSDVLSWGDNWKETILEGTEQSEFAIIVISESFFDREWTERELSEFMQRQNTRKQKIVLPLLYNVTFDELKQKYPLLEYIQGVSSDKYSKEQIAILLAKELIKRYKE